MKKVIKIGKKEIRQDGLFFIIEEGQANWGDFDKAIKMIDLASECGADAIEFQFAIPEDFYVKGHPYLEVYKKNQLSVDKMIKLIKYSLSKGLEFITAPLSHNLIEPLTVAGTSAFNINASDINNPQMLEAVAKSGLPYFISLPLADEEEIDWAIERVEKINPNYILLHGQHTMASGEGGVQPVHTSLGYIDTLKNKYNGFVGFIDHTPLLWMPSCAISAGANIITKHLCISRGEKGPDWQICLEPEEMKESIITARAIAKSTNNKQKILAPGEVIDKSIMRRSIVSNKDIKKNKVISSEDLDFKRPGTGISPSDYNHVIGKIALKDIEKDSIINEIDIK